MLFCNAVPHSLVILHYGLTQSVTQRWSQAQLRHSQCFPSNPLVSNKVQQTQLWPSPLQLFILSNGQSKSSSGLLLLDRQQCQKP